MSASYNRKPSEKILEQFNLLPPVPAHWGNRPVTTHFRVLDQLNGCVLFTQFAEETHYDRPSEGISVYPDDFIAGTINADGKVVELTDLRCCRLIMMHYHGGWYITVVDDVQRLHPQFAPVDWIHRFTRIKDELLREEVTLAYFNLVTGHGQLKDHYDYLHLVHERHSKRRIGLHDTSLIFA